MSTRLPLPFAFSADRDGPAVTIGHLCIDPVLQDFDPLQNAIRLAHEFRATFPGDRD